jgi:hypothetical protein
MSKWSDPERRLQGFMINKSVLFKLKAYAVETEQTFEQVVKDDFEAFEQALVKKATQVDEIRFKAIEAEQVRRIEQALADQHPLIVPGHEVDPLGPQLEQPITI